MNRSQATGVLLAVNGLQNELNNLPGQISTHSSDSGQVVDPFDVFVTDKELAKITKKLFSDGHHARSVEEGFKFLNNLVKKQSGLNKLDGANLMRQAFSANAPVLKLNALTNQSENDEQIGYMEIFTGCMIGIRNPRAHEHDWEDSEAHALQLLAMANHLVERVRLSSK